jgi:hypothetical protein
MTDIETTIIEDDQSDTDMTIPFQLIVEEQPGSDGCYRVRWCDDEPKNIFLANIPPSWLDLIPYMVARKLLEQGNNPERLLIVKLRGADFDLMRSPLGVVAAPPLLNTNKPVTQRVHNPYWDHANVDVEWYK